MYRGSHNHCNTEKAELTSIFVSGYIHTVLKLTSILEKCLSIEMAERA